MSGAGGPKPLDYYKESRKRAWERMMAGVLGLVMKAYRGHREPLIDYLSGSPQLSVDDGGWLAWLIEEDGRRLEPKKPRNGRPPGSVTPKTLATACASYLVRTGKASWRRKHDRKRAPTKGPKKAPIESLIKRAIELVEAKIPQARGKIDGDDVKSGSNLRPSAHAVDYVLDHLREANAEIIELALK